MRAAGGRALKDPKIALHKCDNLCKIHFLITIVEKKATLPKVILHFHRIETK